MAGLRAGCQLRLAHSLGECYAALGDLENARTYYQMALDKLPEGDRVNHARITRILADLDVLASVGHRPRV